MSGPPRNPVADDREGSVTLALAGLVVAVSLLTYLPYGFGGLMLRDDAIHIYAAQQLLDGVPPYVSIFDIKGPVAAFIASVGVWLARAVGVDDLLGVRVLAWLCCGLGVSGLFLLGRRLFESNDAGLLGAAFFLTFWGFGIFAISGPRAKTWAVVFEIFALLLVVRRRWFGAGALASLATFTWQPMAIYALATVFVAWRQSPSPVRLRHAAQAIAGALLPAAAIVVYFASQGALFDLVDGMLLFQLFYLDRGAFPGIGPRLVAILSSLEAGYKLMAMPILVGLGVSLAVSLARCRYGRRETATTATASHLIVASTLPLALAWTVLDYQGFADFFVLLPYAALGLAFLAHQTVARAAGALGLTSRARHAATAVVCSALVLGASWAYGDHDVYVWKVHRNGYAIQKAQARQIAKLTGDRVKLAAVGMPMALAVMHERNFSRFIIFAPGAGFVEHMDARLEGGVESWLADLRAYDPDVILHAYAGEPLFGGRLQRLLAASYRRLPGSGWRPFVKTSLLEAASPPPAAAR